MPPANMSRTNPWLAGSGSYGSEVLLASHGFLLDFLHMTKSLCTKCGLEKTVRIGTLHGQPKTRYRCLPCSKVYSRERYIGVVKPIETKKVLERKREMDSRKPPEGLRDCKKCGVRKTTDSFPKTRKWPRYECIDCTNIYKSMYCKEYRQRPNVKMKWQEQNKKYKPKWGQKVDVRLHKNVTTVIKDCLRGKKRSYEIYERLGWNINDLINHLTGLFTDGMTWDNYGDWHIDHMIPRSLIPYTSLEDPNFYLCWNLSNLQPLWAKDNMRKGNKLIHDLPLWFGLETKVPKVLNSVEGVDTDLDN